MKTKHTPGPWGCDWTRGREIDSKYGIVAVVRKGNAGTTWVSNACLIAAAPELLEACKMAVKKHGEFDYLMKAIAKAEGGKDD